MSRAQSHRLLLKALPALVIAVFGGCGDALLEGHFAEEDGLEGMSLDQSLAGCTAVEVKAVKAVGDDGKGNIPTNVVDDKLNTFWSRYGKSSWIQLELAKEADVNSIAIAWYRGSVRKNVFSLAASQDGE
jgi:hypothetical protein